MVHLSNLRPRIWSSWLLPSNQRLLGQRHDKLRIPQENIITWVPTLTNRCRSRIRAQTNPYLSLPVEHASSDETPTTVRRWALDLFTDAMCTLVSRMDSMSRCTIDQSLTTYSNHSSAFTGLWNQMLQTVTGSRKNKQKFGKSDDDRKHYTKWMLHTNDWDWARVSPNTLPDEGDGSQEKIVDPKHMLQHICSIAE